MRNAFQIFMGILRQSATHAPFLFSTEARNFGLLTVVRRVTRKWGATVSLLALSNNLCAQAPTPGLKRQIPASEYSVLVELFDSTDGPNWTRKFYWNDASAAYWQGVNVSGFEYDRHTGEVTKIGNVSGLSLSMNRLKGSIPDSLGNLAHLRYLSLEYNELTGSIPDSLGNLEKLSHLLLFFNQLDGRIPQTLGNLSQLLYLDCSHNELSESIPVSIGGLSQLTTLSLSGNQLSGEIPISLGQLGQLEYLYLENNQLMGNIPASFGNLGALQVLGLHDNQLTGSIPDSLGSLTQLRSLRLNSNRLTGSIPASLGNLIQLEDLWLFSNQLSGVIPDSFGNLNKLGVLLLTQNQLTGEIPESMGNLRQLVELNLSENQLSGKIPSSLGNIHQLQFLDARSNRLSGEIPSSLGNLTELVTLDLSHNRLSGIIPTNLISLPSFWLFIFDHNCLVILGCPPCIQDPGAANRATIDQMRASGMTVQSSPQNQCMCLALSNDRVPEQWTGWFGNVIAVECDGGSVADFDIPTFLALGPGGTDNALFQTFFLNSLSNRMKFDYETRSSYSIRVATPAYNGLTGLFTIFVTDVDETAPPENTTIPVLQNVTPMPEGGIGLGLAGIPGTVYRLEISTNLLFWETWRMVTVPSVGGHQRCRFSQFPELPKVLSGDPAMKS